MKVHRRTPLGVKVYVYRHVFIVLSAAGMWDRGICKVPKGYSIHHKDGNRYNNDLSNLQLLTKTEHHRLHRKEKKPKEYKSLLRGRTLDEAFPICCERNY